jgi:hypothetical protein
MTELMEMAIQRIRALPPERQDEVARFLMDMADEGDVYVLSPEEEASLAGSIAQAERGEFASRESVDAVFQKHGG